MGPLHEDLCPFMTNLAAFLSEWVIFQQILEEIKTHILISVTYSENLAVYEIRWKN
jgi:hypothetical protein